MTVKAPATPAVVGDGKPATASLLAAAGLTITAPLPVIEGVNVSVAVTVWVPGVFSVA